VSKPISKLSGEEISQACTAAKIPIILSPQQLGELLGKSTKTIYEWIAHGYLRGTYRKRGKHIFFWRDRVLRRIFNDPEWKHDRAE